MLETRAGHDTLKLLSVLCDLTVIVSSMLAAVKMLEARLGPAWRSIQAFFDSYQRVRVEHYYFPGR